MTEAAMPRPVAAPRAPAAPRHLQVAGRDLWRRVAGSYQLEAHHEAILGAACEAADRIAEARAAIEADGAYIEGRFGKKAHPALAVERDSRIAMLRAIRELGLDLIEASRPPTRWRP